MLAVLASFALLADPAVLDRVLQQYVRDDGTVRYGALKAGLAPLTQYVEAVGAVSPESHPQLFPSRDAQLAYWINAYNALVLHSMAAEYPGSQSRLTGLLGRANYFYRRKFVVGGKSRSLADIENNTIRKMGEPRIHFAIVCASKGCPWLSRRAYTAANLEEQLAREQKRFLGQSRNLRVEGGVVYLSPIFDWFKDDLAKLRGELAAGRKIKFLEWDWSMNDAPN